MDEISGGRGVGGDKVLQEAGQCRGDSLMPVELNDGREEGGWVQSWGMTFQAGETSRAVSLRQGTSLLCLRDRKEAWGF